jgi:hypothetical protein
VYVYNNVESENGLLYTFMLPEKFLCNDNNVVSVIIIVYVFPSGAVYKGENGSRKLGNVCGLRKSEVYYR